VRRLHPLTVPLRILNVLGSVVLIVVLSIFFGGSSPLNELGPVVIGLGLLAAAGIGLYQYAYYRRFTYGVTPDTLDIASGVISRQRREIPLGRIQNVDISQGILQRALGIAAVDFETAGGGSTEAQLQFVALSEARRLQDAIRGHETPDEEAAQTTTAAATGPGPAGEALFTLDDRSLLVLSALSFDLRVFSLVQTLGAFAAPALATQLFELPTQTQVPIVVLAIAGLVVGGWLGGAVVTFTRYYGFRLTRLDGELRYERGLLQRYSGTIPLEKVQTLTVRENVLMRRFGYAGLSIETAGYGGGEEPSGGSEAAVPLDDRHAVLALAHELEPFDEPELASPPSRTERRYRRRYRLIAGGVAILLAAGVWLLDGPQLWYLAPAVVAILGAVLAGPAAARHYRSRGYSLTEGYAVTRNGWWRRRTAIVPTYRFQTVIDRRSIFQRRWNLATLEFDTAGSLSLGGASGRAVDIEASTAGELADQAASDLQVALTNRRRGPASDTVAD
jgi:putative membrane protein